MGPYKHLQDLDFSGDICLLSQRYQAIIEMVQDLKWKADKGGLKNNMSKTKGLKIYNTSEEALFILKE